VKSPEKRGSDYVAIFVRQLGGAIIPSKQLATGTTVRIRLPLLLVPSGGAERWQPRAGIGCETLLWWHLTRRGLGAFMTIQRVFLAYMALVGLASGHPIGDRAADQRIFHQAVFLGTDRGCTFEAARRSTVKARRLKS